MAARIVLGEGKSQANFEKKKRLRWREREKKMATIGTLAAFDPKNQTRDEYTEILGQFFMANGIDEAEKQQAILISVVGAATYSLTQSV